MNFTQAVEKFADRVELLARSAQAMSRPFTFAPARNIFSHSTEASGGSRNHLMAQFFRNADFAKEMQRDIVRAAVRNVVATGTDPVHALGSAADKGLERLGLMNRGTLADPYTGMTKGGMGVFRGVSTPEEQARYHASLASMRATEGGVAARSAMEVARRVAHLGWREVWNKKERKFEPKSVGMNVNRDAVEHMMGQRDFLEKVLRGHVSQFGRSADTRKAEGILDNLKQQLEGVQDSGASTGHEMRNIQDQFDALNKGFGAFSKSARAAAEAVSDSKPNSIARGLKLLAAKARQWFGPTEMMKNKSPWERMALGLDATKGAAFGTLGALGTAGALGAPTAFRTLTGSLELLAMTIGQQLIPALTFMSSKIQGMDRWMRDHPNATGIGTYAAAGLAATAGAGWLAKSVWPNVKESGKLIGGAGAGLGRAAMAHPYVAAGVLGLGASSYLASHAQGTIDDPNAGAFKKFMANVVKYSPMGLIGSGVNWAGSKLFGGGGNPMDELLVAWNSGAMRPEMRGVEDAWDRIQMRALEQDPMEAEKINRYAEQLQKMLDQFGDKYLKGVSDTPSEISRLGVLGG